MDRPNHDPPSWPHRKKGVLPRPSWTDQFMIPQRFSPWSFVALRGHKRCSPPPFVDRPNHDPAKVFFVVLRGPSWIKKGVLPRPTWTDQIMIPQRFSSVALHRKKGVLPRPSWTDQFMIPQRFSPWSFVALRGHKRCSPPPFVDRQNHDPAKVFFVVLRGPSWIKKGVLPCPSWTDQNSVMQFSVQINVNKP